MAFRENTGWGRLALTVVLLFVPAISSVVIRALWPHPPAQIPTHWSGSGPADGFSNADVAWWILFAATIVAGLVGVAVIVLGSDVLAIRRAIALGAVGVVAAAIAIAWPAFALSETAAGGLKGDQPTTFTLFLFALVWGGITFLAAGPRTGAGSTTPTHRQATTSSVQTSQPR